MRTEHPLTLIDPFIYINFVHKTHDLLCIYRFNPEILTGYTGQFQQVGRVSVGSMNFALPGQQVGRLPVRNTDFTSSGQQVGRFRVGSTDFTSPGQQVGRLLVGSTDFTSPGEQVGRLPVGSTDFRLPVGSTEFASPGQFQKWVGTQLVTQSSHIHQDKKQIYIPNRIWMK